MFNMRPDGIGSLVSIVTGTQIAPGGTFNTTPVDFSACEGNAMLLIAVNAAGTGTLDIIAQMGTASVSTWTSIGTDAMFLPNTGVGGTVQRIIVTVPAEQKLALNLEKIQPWVRFNVIGTDSSYRLTISALAPKKYANFDAL